MKKEGKNGEREPLAREERRIPVCQYAPEWAEHARFNREGEPCDDGRAGIICGERDGEDPCPL